MVTDHQVKRLRQLIHTEKTLEIAALKAGMSEKTARKYLQTEQLPSDMKQPRHWRTRQSPFESDWEEVERMLEVNPGLQAVTLFKYLQQSYPGTYQDGQLRSFQDHVKIWRATHGPSKEVYFPQVHQPGRLCQSDFTHMDSLGIMIAGQEFPHLIYHFVLTYSNWESGSICFSESFESLSDGLQKSLWELGKVPDEHRSDQLSAAVQQSNHPEEFTQRYKALLAHYHLKGTKIQVGKPNQNGDVEQSHYRFKQAVEQTLLLRGSRQFESRQAYQLFLNKVFVQLNAGRQDRLQEELAVMKALPAQRIELNTIVKVRVRPSSTIRILRNTYSVNSQLIGEEVEVRVKSDSLQIWYARQLRETLPRLRGRNKHRIDYRHLIEGLLKKPGAFDNYLYKEDLFPNSQFRMVYDALKSQSSSQANQEYIRILHLATQESEGQVNDAIHYLLKQGLAVSYTMIKSLIQSLVPPRTDVHIVPPDLIIYDSLLQNWQVNVCRN